MAYLDKTVYFIFPVYGLLLGTLVLKTPSLLRKYNNYIVKKNHKCLSKDFVHVDNLEKYMIENCKNSYCEVRLDTYEHSKKAKEVVNKYFKNGYFVSDKNCYVCNEYMNKMFITKIE